MFPPDSLHVVLLKSGHHSFVCPSQGSAAGSARCVICLTGVSFHHLIEVGPVSPLFNYHSPLTFSRSSDFFLDQCFRFFSVSLAGENPLYLEYYR